MGCWLREKCLGATNEVTDDGRNMGFYSDLLNQAIRSIIDVQDEKDLDSLFTGSRTSALTNPISGQDDFELLYFVVAQERPLWDTETPSL